MAAAARRVLTILTEENPQLNEISYILNRLGLCARAAKISAVCTGNKWNGEYTVLTAETPTPIFVTLYLVKGHGSFVDYVVYDHANPSAKTSTPVLLVESTKTDDSESRNTAINQRFTKFAVARLHFPNTPLVLYFNAEHKPKTPTSVFGRRLLSSFGVETVDLTGKNLLSDAPPFTSITELFASKNAIREKKGNVSVRLTELGDHLYSITAKLAKGANLTISHDPNKGLVTGVASVVHSLDSAARFIVKEHGVDTTKLTRTADKFWYANGRYDLRLEGSDLTTLGCCKQGEYWTRDVQSEKASTILFQNLLEEAGLWVIYHNHSSSARSFFLDSLGTPLAVPKTITIPDLVFLDRGRKRLFICEGKIKKDLGKGVQQLNNQTAFMEFTKKYYPEFAVERGLCLYVPSLTEIAELQSESPYPIWFALDSEGNFVHRLLPLQDTPGQLVGAGCGKGG